MLFRNLCGYEYFGFVVVFIFLQTEKKSNKYYTCNVLLFLLSFLFEVLQFPNWVCGGYSYPRNLG